MPGMPYGCQMMLTWLDDPSAGAPGFLNGHLKGSKRCRWSQQDKAGHRMNDGTWWDMMGHDGTWRHGISVVRKRCVYGVNTAWTQLRWCTVHWVHCPFSVHQAGHSPSRIGSRNISDIYRNFYRYLNFCSHLHMSTSTFSLEWRGVLRCKTCPHVIGPASSHLWWGGTTALPWLHAAADAGFDHPNMGVHKKRHRNTLYTYIYII